jgi:DNA adenine methylase
VLLNKERSPVEVYNDLDGRITRLFRVMRDDGEELVRRLKLTGYSEAEFLACLSAGDSEDEIESARRDFVRWRQSIGGRGDAFSYTKHRVRRGMADVVSGYLSAIDDELPRIIERLRSVQIMQRPAIEVITDWDSPETLIYADPPYVPSTRKSPDVYDQEMSEQDHCELLEVLLQCKGKVILSGYPSSLYDQYLGGWRVLEFDMANHAAGGQEKARTREKLWLNWENS